VGETLRGFDPSERMSRTGESHVRDRYAEQNEGRLAVAATGLPASAEPALEQAYGQRARTSELRLVAILYRDGCSRPH
jgi:hypothetical protein